MAGNKNYYYGLGRRKSSTARVRLSKGKGEWTINDKPKDDYFSGSKYLSNHLARPFAALELDMAEFNISAKVSGGGVNGQVDAITLGVSKALVTLNDDYKATLKRADLLGRDPREKERKKFGLLGARKKRQFSKR